MTAHDPEVLINLHSSLGEGPLWDHRIGVLAWVDILGGLVHLTDPDTGTTTTTPLNTTVGALALSGDNGYLLAVRSGFAALVDGQLQEVSEFSVDEDQRMNDGAADPAGRFLAGTMAEGARPGGGDLYTFDTDGSVRTLIESVTISNGLAWSANGSTLFYVDSATQSIDMIDYDVDSGTIGPRRRWVEIPQADGTPDGITMDDEGCIWVALWGGGVVRRYSPDARLLGEIDFPVPQVTSCAFGGARLDRLFVTSAAVNRPRTEGQGELDGALFVADPGCRGRRESVVPARWP